MSLQQATTDRRILPRWRDSKSAPTKADFASLKPPPEVGFDASSHIARHTEAFNDSPSIGSAAELVSSALLIGKPDLAIAAAKFILQLDEKAPINLIGLANSVLGETQANIVPRPSGKLKWVAQTRQMLRLQPENPVLWADMARHYASLGDKKQSMRCMTTALKLAPNHRWMLRTAARFFVHQEDPVAAHKLLANHPQTKSDPWLIAAELACAQVAAKAPKYWKQANSILRWETFPAVHISELATAIAMMELEVGERKKAKKFIQKALLVPTENTLAQIYWAKENRHLSQELHIDQLVKSSTDAYEAEYRLSMNRGNLLEALKAARVWKVDEPFAARPCAEISFVASLMDDHDLVLEMAGNVKKIDGKIDHTFELNVIFSQLSSGKLNIEQDAAEIERISNALLRMIEQESQPFHALANLGLLQYRYGNTELGRQFYKKAIEMATKCHQADSAAMAAIFSAREALLSADPQAMADIEEAKVLCTRAKSKPGEFYLRKLDALAAQPSARDEILSPGSVNRFLLPEREPFHLKFEKQDDGRFIIWVP